MAKAYPDGEGGWIAVPFGESFTLDGVIYPPGWADSAGDEACEALGWAEIVEPAAPAPGLRVTGRVLADVAGEPHYQLTTEAYTPSVISRLQAKQALLAANLLDDVEAAVSAAPAQVQIYWAEASHLHRDHDVIEGMRAALGWSAEQVDALFVAASTIV